LFYEISSKVVSIKKAIALKKAEIEKIHHFSTLKYVSHELAQQTISLVSCTNRLKRYCNEVYYTATSQQKEKLKDIVIDIHPNQGKSFMDIHSIINYIEYLGKMAGSRVSENLETDISTVTTFNPKDVILMIRSAFRVQSDQKFLSIVYPNLRSCTLTTKKESFIMMVFNLIGNAIKYCYMGTKIQINGRTNRNNTKYILEVIDYGHNIPKNYCDVIFEPGIRLDDIKDENGLPIQKSNQNGTGYGLALVDRCVNALSGERELESEEFSKINYPLIAAYISKKREEKTEISLEENERLQLKNMRLSNDFLECVNRDIYPPDDDGEDNDEFDITYSELDELISIVMYKTIFRVKIPLKTI
jgi:signal transduction histidine kinase